MGLDSNITKRPIAATTDVKYWRKNWVIQNWMDSENCVDQPITEETMQKLLNDLPKMEEDGYTGSEGWDSDDWIGFKEDIKEILEDMKANQTYEYSYNGWW